MHAWANIIHWNLNVHKHLQLDLTESKQTLHTAPVYSYLLQILQKASLNIILKLQDRYENRTDFKTRM